MPVAHSPGWSRVPPSPIAATDFPLPSEDHARVAGEDGDGAVIHRLGLWKEDILNRQLRRPRPHEIFRICNNVLCNFATINLGRCYRQTVTTCLPLHRYFFLLSLRRRRWDEHPDASVGDREGRGGGGLARHPHARRKSELRLGVRPGPMFGRSRLGPPFPADKKVLCQSGPKLCTPFIIRLKVEVLCVLFLTQPACMVPNQNTKNLYLQADD